MINRIFQIEANFNKDVTLYRCRTVKFNYLTDEEKPKVLALGYCPAILTTASRGEVSSQIADAFYNDEGWWSNSGREHLFTTYPYFWK